MTALRTWHFEMAAVGLVLAAVFVSTGRSWVEAVGAAAVLLSFGHATVADRLAEREGRRVTPEVPCYPMLLRYYVGKEAAWLLYFSLHRSWSALVGVGVFLAYPAWRSWYRRRWPL